MVGVIQFAPSRDNMVAVEYTLQPVLALGLLADQPPPMGD
jgi:hypothetical protein